MVVACLGCCASLLYDPWRGLVVRARTIKQVRAIPQFWDSRLAESRAQGSDIAFELRMRPVDDGD